MNAGGKSLHLFVQLLLFNIVTGSPLSLFWLFLALVSVSPTSTVPYNACEKNPDISPELPSWFSSVVMLALGISLLFGSYVTFLLSWVSFLDHQKLVALCIFTSSNLGVYVIHIYFCRFLSSILPSYVSSFLLSLAASYSPSFSLFVPLICLLLKRQNIFYYLLCIFNSNFFNLE